MIRCPKPVPYWRALQGAQNQQAVNMVQIQGQYGRLDRLHSNLCTMDCGQSLTTLLEL